MVEAKFVTTGYAALDRLVDEFNVPKLILVTHNNKKNFYLILQHLCLYQEKFQWQYFL